MKRLIISIAGVLCLSHFSYANEDLDSKEAPSLELLEFIAGFTSAEEQWVDPLTLKDMLNAGSTDSNANDEVKEKSE
ncbi:MAG: hypothetical protein R3240_04895 [Gammaproteobacteria bacterium]|nr:hypothetical protein [Gammaproteobacteria bacterium]